MLKDIILYILQHASASSICQDKKSIEKARLFCILYLVDWHAAVKVEKTMTGIQWDIRPNWLGDSNEIGSTIADQNIFRTVIDPSISASIKQRVVLQKDVPTKQFEQWEIAVIDRVLEVANQRKLEELLTFTFSTYPLLTADADKPFNMLEKAKVYKEFREQQAKKQKNGSQQS